MGKNFSLKILAISIALVMVVSCTAVLYSGTEAEKGISEGGGKGVISLMAPPFIGVAGAAEAAGGGGGAAPQAGTTFLEEEGGISAYVNVGQEIDLEKAETAFKSIETSNDSYIIGEIDLPGLPEDVDPHAYVHKDGWIVAYYSKNAPASKIMEWYEYDGGVITTTTLEDAMHEICLAVEIPYVTIKEGIKYYDFEYPNANRMMLIVDTAYGKEYQWDSFNLEIPVECWLYEGSWSHYFSGDTDHSLSYSRVKIDGDTISDPSLPSAHVYTYHGYGMYSSEQLEAGLLHIVKIEQDLQWSDSWGTIGVATVLIYRTS